MTPRQIVAFVDKDTLDFAPGTKYSYSNTGYVLLGMILEKVTGRPYAAYLEREFFKPLGLTQTSYCPQRPTDPQFAEGYAASSGTVKPAEPLSMTQPFSAGALCSTVRDLVKWHRALQDGRVVGARSYSLMTTADTLNNGSRINYGFGLVPGQLGSERTIGHSGGINGFTTYGMYLPDQSLNVIVLTNSDGGPGPLAQNIARAMIGMPLVPLPKPLVAVALADSLRNRIPGVYDFGRIVLHVTVEDGRVMAQPDGPGQPKFPARSSRQPSLRRGGRSLVVGHVHQRERQDLEGAVHAARHSTGRRNPKALSRCRIAHLNGERHDFSRVAVAPDSAVGRIRLRNELAAAHGAALAPHRLLQGAE
jgi:CubicO group peptidase (beta-lactamase class C family)